MDGVVCEGICENGIERCVVVRHVNKLVYVSQMLPHTKFGQRVKDVVDKRKRMDARCRPVLLFL